jgi:hypothetical protein
MNQTYHGQLGYALVSNVCYHSILTLCLDFRVGFHRKASRCTQNSPPKSAVFCRLFTVDFS